MRRFKCHSLNNWSSSQKRLSSGRSVERRPRRYAQSKHSTSSVVVDGHAHTFARTQYKYENNSLAGRHKRPRFFEMNNVFAGKTCTNNLHVCSTRRARNLKWSKNFGARLRPTQHSTNTHTHIYKYIYVYISVHCDWRGGRGTLNVRTIGDGRTMAQMSILTM